VLALVPGSAGSAGSFLLQLASFLLDSILEIEIDRLELVGGFLLARLMLLGACRCCLDAAPAARSLHATAACRCCLVAAPAGGSLFAASICTLQTWGSLGDVALVCFE